MYSLIKRIGLIILISLIVYVNADYFFPLFQSEDLPEEIDNSPSIGEKHSVNQETNILLAGIDNGGDVGDNMTDSLILLTIDQSDYEIDLLSIPRDTKIDFYDLEPAKINSGYAEGGLKLTTELAEKLLEVEIDHTVVVNYSVFIELVDAVGGVELEIEDDLFYQDKSDNLLIDIKAGKQKLSGEKALDFVRYRDRITGDIGRISRQHKFLTSFKENLVKPDNLTELPGALLSIYNNVETDLKPLEIARLSYEMRNFSDYQMEMDLLDGRHELIDGISYWVVSEE